MAVGLLRVTIPLPVRRGSWLFWFSDPIIPFGPFLAISFHGSRAHGDSPNFFTYYSSERRLLSTQVLQGMVYFLSQGHIG